MQQMDLWNATSPPKRSSTRPAGRSKPRKAKQRS